AAPAGAASFSLKHTEAVEVEVVSGERVEAALGTGGQRWPLGKGTVLRLSMGQASTEANDNKVTVSYYGEGGEAMDQAGLFLTGIGISLDVDADRDGVVEDDNPHKATWTWGPEGHGAVLLVNCDRESP
ncbi:PADI2 deiminase, partial [Nothocercus julius]|nr:PADI2 deiminase [Nothocercus julius]